MHLSLAFNLFNPYGWSTQASKNCHFHSPIASIYLFQCLIMFCSSFYMLVKSLLLLCPFDLTFTSCQLLNFQQSFCRQHYSLKQSNQKLKIIDENKITTNISMTWQLAELHRIEGTQWFWSRTIGTPTSLCIANYWTARAS